MTPVVTIRSARARADGRDAAVVGEAAIVSRNAANTPTVTSGR
jgi:hypothetical protein